MLSEALINHNDILDTWVASEHIEVIEIVGTGLLTVQGFWYEEFKRQECHLGLFFCSNVPYLKPVPDWTLKGDKTVLAASADAYPGDKQTYYIDLKGLQESDGTETNHGNITESTLVQDLLTGVMNDSPIESELISIPQPSHNGEYDVVSVHSPVSMFVVDENGNEVKVVGEGVDTQVIADIPGSTYMEFAEGKYVILPSETNYEVRLEGEDDSSYTIRIDSVSHNSEREKQFEYIGTTNLGMIASFKKSEGTFTPLSVDADGDGVVDEMVEIGSGVSEYMYGDLYNEILALNLDYGQETELIAKIRNAERFNDRDPGVFSKIEIQSLQSVMDAIKRYEQQGYITNEESEHINGIIESIKRS